jgi:hypothetical protein
MKSVIPQEEIAALRESITVTTNQHSSKAAPQSYVGSLLRYNQDIAQHIANDRLLQLCRILFGPHVRVSTISGSVNAPGVKRGDFHVDWPYSERDETCIRGQGASTLAHLVTIWMLTDFTVQNGATIAIPGSHRLREQGIMPGDFVGHPNREEHRLVGTAGDVILLDARVWHAIGPNDSGADRVAVIIRFAPWWLNLNPLREHTRDRRLMVDDCAGSDPFVSPLSIACFNTLPLTVRFLFDSMVDPDVGSEAAAGG